MLEDLYTELQLRGYSEKTKLAYSKINQDFFEYVCKDAALIEKDEIKKYLTLWGLNYIFSAAK